MSNISESKTVVTPDFMEKLKKKVNELIPQVEEMIAETEEFLNSSETFIEDEATGDEAVGEEYHNYVMDESGETAHVYCEVPLSTHFKLKKIIKKINATRDPMKGRDSITVSTLLRSLINLCDYLDIPDGAIQSAKDLDGYIICSFVDLLEDQETA